MRTLWMTRYARRSGPRNQLWSKWWLRVRPKGSPSKSTAPEASRSVKLRGLEIALEQERRGMRPFSNSSEIVEEKGNYMRSLWLKSLVPALALATLPMLPAVSQAGIEVGVSISVAPPILPVYVQPHLPAG